MNYPSDDGQRTLDVLHKLVAFDTRNPPRTLNKHSEVFSWLRDQLPGFKIRLIDEGNGSVTLLAVRGKPTLLFNYHLDTVPVAEGWSRDPFRLLVTESKAIGLGACDIKGALAVMLSTCQSVDNDAALLITSDEEAGNSTCVRRFLDTYHGYKRIVVAEPTQCKAVTSHRGIVSGRLSFHGVAGHASSARAINDSAVHRAMRWGAAALDALEANAEHPDEVLHDVRLNIGHFEGGVKPNMIAASATAAFNLRIPPSSDQDGIVDALVNLADPDHVAGLELPFKAPALPTAKRGPAALSEAAILAGELGVEISDPVDFWTEAALFSEAGMNALVLGSGDIEQAHTADEWVALDQLETLHDVYTRILQHGVE
ncbi:MAG: acetylornithine deacetylase [Gammaproteobacteria bacterium]